MNGSRCDATENSEFHSKGYQMTFIYIKIGKVQWYDVCLCVIQSGGCNCIFAVENSHHQSHLYRRRSGGQIIQSHLPKCIWSRTDNTLFICLKVFDDLNCQEIGRQTVNSLWSHTNQNLKAQILFFSICQSHIWIWKDSTGIVCRRRFPRHELYCFRYIIQAKFCTGLRLGKVEVHLLVQAPVLIHKDCLQTKRKWGRHLVRFRFRKMIKAKRNLSIHNFSLLLKLQKKLNILCKYRW